MGAGTSSEADFAGDDDSGFTLSFASMGGVGAATADSTVTGDDAPIATAFGAVTSTETGSADGSASAGYGAEGPEGTSLVSASVDGTGSAETDSQGSVDGDFAIGTGTGCQWRQC